MIEGHYENCNPDITKTCADGGLEPVPDSLLVSAITILWTHEGHVRTGERLILDEQDIEINRASSIFPCGPVGDPGMSRNHAHLHRRARGSWEIRDAGSKNGTFVNGSRVGDGPRALCPGDVLRIGDSLFLFKDVFVPPVADADVPNFIGVSDVAREVRSSIAKYASSNLPVLITGESGVGKEVVSHALASLGRRPGTFVKFNAAGITSALAGTSLFGNVKGAFTDAREARPGLFREADHGTLFIDEVGELPRDVQSQFLRVIEDGMVLPVGGTVPVSVDARVVAATNRDLTDKAVFRPDLYMRLAQLTIHVPPVSARREDIPLLVAAFSNGRRFSVRSMERFMLYSWPMNVREIRNLVAQTLAECGSGSFIADLPRVVIDRMPNIPAFSDTDMREGGAPAITGANIESVLIASGGNMAEAARIFGKDRGQFYRMVKKLGFDPRNFR